MSKVPVLHRSTKNGQQVGVGQAESDWEVPHLDESSAVDSDKVLPDIQQGQGCQEKNTEQVEGAAMGREGRSLSERDCPMGLWSFRAIPTWQGNDATDSPQPPSSKCSVSSLCRFSLFLSETITALMP